MLVLIIILVSRIIVVVAQIFNFFIQLVDTISKITTSLSNYTNEVYIIQKLNEIDRTTATSFLLLVRVEHFLFKVKEVNLQRWTERNAVGLRDPLGPRLPPMRPQPLP